MIIITDGLKDRLQNSQSHVVDEGIKIQRDQVSINKT